MWKPSKWFFFFLHVNRREKNREETAAKWADRAQHSGDAFRKALQSAQCRLQTAERACTDIEIITAAELQSKVYSALVILLKRRRRRRIIFDESKNGKLSSACQYQDYGNSTRYVQSSSSSHESAIIITNGCELYVAALFICSENGDNMKERVEMIKLIPHQQMRDYNNLYFLLDDWKQQRQQLYNDASTMMMMIIMTDYYILILRVQRNHQGKWKGLDRGGHSPVIIIIICWINPLRYQQCTALYWACIGEFVVVGYDIAAAAAVVYCWMRSVCLPALNKQTNTQQQQQRESAATCTVVDERRRLYIVLLLLIL